MVVMTYRLANTNKTGRMSLNTLVIAQELGENEEDLYLHAIDVAREYLQDYRDNQMGVE